MFTERYRHSIYMRATLPKLGAREYLQAVYDNPRLLRKHLQMMRQKNPNREYFTDDKENP